VLVTIEIIFRCLFEAFQHASQAVGTGTSDDDDTWPKKKTRQPRVITCYFKASLHTNRVITCRESSKGGSSKCADQRLAATQTTSSMTAASAPPPVGGTFLTIRSNADARDCAR
jgi:hypothetical protein